MMGLFGGPAAYKMPMMSAEKPKSWIDGGKFKGKDALALGLGLLGTGLGGQPILGQFLMQNMMQRKESEREDERYARQRADGLADYRAKKGIDAEFATETPEIGVFEDNAGNRFRYNKQTGMPIDDSPVFVDKATKQMIQDGALINVPNPYLSKGPTQAHIDALRRGEGTAEQFDMKFGQGAAARAMGVNGPAPQLNAQGVPASLTRQQYEATVRAMGKQQTDAWMQRHGIRLGS